MESFTAGSTQDDGQDGSRAFQAGNGRPFLRVSVVLRDRPLTGHPRALTASRERLSAIGGTSSESTGIPRPALRVTWLATCCHGAQTGAHWCSFVGTGLQAHP